VASDYPGVHVREVNVLDEPDRTAGFNVFSTPFIVVNGEMWFVGVPREADLRARIAQAFA
jgi:hypothetical protein